jgi:hypothetical protein
MELTARLLEIFINEKRSDHAGRDKNLDLNNHRIGRLLTDDGPKDFGQWTQDNSGFPIG